MKVELLNKKESALTLSAKYVKLTQYMNELVGCTIFSYYGKQEICVSAFANSYASKLIGYILLLQSSGEYLFGYFRHLYSAKESNLVFNDEESFVRLYEEIMKINNLDNIKITL